MFAGRQLPGRCRRVTRSDLDYALRACGTGLKTRGTKANLCLGRSCVSLTDTVPPSQHHSRSQLFPLSPVRGRGPG